ncbi:MAG: methyl-accepting chemotaxis protein [Verrucomicrobia bacterium]|nr:methyl-accepting chemotaxis protein [Verrucomicrobiota bacterium]
MRNLSIQQQIALTFASLAIVACALTTLAFSRLHKIQTETATLAASSRIELLPAGYFESLVEENFILVEHHLLSASTDVKQRLEPQIQTTATNLSRQLGKMIGSLSSPEEQRRGAALQTSVNDYLGTHNELVARSRQAKSQEVAEGLLQQVQPAFQRVMVAARAFNEAARARSAAGFGNVPRTVSITKLGLCIGLIISLGVLLASGCYLAGVIQDPLRALALAMERIKDGDFTHRLNVARPDEFGRLAETFNQMAASLGALLSRVQTSGQQVNNSTNQIAATARQQQQTAREIAQTTIAIGQTSKEISTTSQQLVETIQELSGVAEQTSRLADSGQSSLMRMQTTIQQILLASAGIASKLAVLNEKAANIGTFVTTINKVADQTNLLSLNAAIEAEKAGEYGLGFSVVATEIRRLADQTAVATNDIEKMVKEIQGAVTAGVMGMDKFSEAVRQGVNEVNQVGAQLGQIIDQVQVLTPRFEAVNGGMKTQAAGATQISEALAHLSDSARQTSESLEQSSRVIEQLNDASRVLQHGVERFVIAA